MFNPFLFLRTLRPGTSPASAMCVFRPACRLRRVAAALLLVVALPAHAGGAGIDARVACQTAIETVRWSNTLWPETNPEPKPSLSEVLSADAIRARVIDSLRMETALENLYGEHIGEAMLQAELDRMSAATRAPDQLRQLYAALGNDAARIADCVARPTLVRQHLETRYANDILRHDPVRAQAEAELLGRGKRAVGRDVVFVRDSSGKDELDGVRSAEQGLRIEIALAAHAWDARLERLGAMSRQASGPSTSALRETDAGFVHETLVSVDGNRMTVRMRTWPKIPFGAWWQTEAMHWSATPHRKGRATVEFSLPPVTGRHAPFDIAKGGVDDTWRTEAEAPSGRRDHSAVWTGTEMIVWGGYNYYEGALRSGARYSPLTDTWVPVPLTNAPAAREDHVAIWTGSEMIVFGGYSASNAGGIYDPVADSWQPMSNPPISYQLSGFTAVWADDEMIVWGGYSNASHTNQGARYFPATNTWSKTFLGNAPSARSGHSAVWTGTRMIVWGGYGQPNGELNDGRAYDPETNTWMSTSLADAPTARSGHSAVWTGEDMLVWGGRTGQASKNDGGRYDPESNTWSPMTNVGVPEARFAFPAIWSGAQMLIWGGYCQQQWECASGGRYDPGTDAWTPLPASDVLGGRNGHTAVWAGDGVDEMLVWGGGSFLDSRNTGARYDPVLNQWTPMGGIESLPSPRSGHTAVWTGSEMLVWGGNGGNGALASGGRYHADTATWTPLFYSSAERQGHSAVWTGLEMIVWGGTDVAALASGERYNPLLDQWGTVAQDGVPARYGHSAVWLGGEMIVWGGRDGNTYLDSGARYQPSNNTWTLMSSAFAPSVRYGHTAIAAGAEMIVWGGRAGITYLGDGMRYSPASNTWSPVSSSLAPAPRQAHTALWTGTEMIVWGGMGEGNDPRSDGARYSPTDDAWTPLPSMGTPSARHGHAAVWTGEEMLIWGGLNGGNLALDSGARYRVADDGWAPMTLDSAPSARGRHTAVWTGDEMLIWAGSADGEPTNSLGAYAAATTPPSIDMFADGFE